jgi:hypothetical protein
MNQNLRIGDTEIPQEKAEVVLDILFSTMLKGYPWVSSLEKTKRSGSNEVMVPEPFLTLRDNPPVRVATSMQTTHVQFMIMKYIDPTFEIPLTASQNVTKYTYPNFIAWWNGTPLDFRKHTEDFVADVKLKVFGDHDKLNILDEQKELLSKT